MPNVNENYKTENTHISNIRIGDCVFHDGHYRTVGNNNLQYDSFMGISLWGDTYRSGTILVKRVVFNNIK